MRPSMLAPTVLLGSRECELPPPPRPERAASPDRPEWLAPRRGEGGNDAPLDTRRRASAA